MTSTKITWSWGTNTVLDFDPATDVLDFGWFSSNFFTIEEVDGSVVISIPSNNQTYTLTGVSLSDLTIDNITASDSSAVSAWEDALASSSSDDDGDAAVVPDAPENLSATTVSESQVQLSWDAATVEGTGTVSQYNIYVNGELVGTTSDTSYTISDLAADTEYSFTVTAVDEAGESASSDALDVTTDAATDDSDDTGTSDSDTGDTSDSGSDGSSDDTSGDDTSDSDDSDSSSSSKTFSPYIDMSLSSAQDVVDIVSEAGLTAVTLAFLVTSGTDTIGWGGSGDVEDATLYNGTSMASVIAELQEMGVEVTISLGGAAGSEAATTFSSVDALVAAYQSIIDTYGVTKLDFDIEGSSLSDTDANDMRNEALAILQANNPDLEISFTLPVTTDGLTDAGLALLESAAEAGVEISYVNIMAMDYGDYYDSGDMGDDAIAAAEATLAQLDDLGIDTQLVITPMIGINDVTSEVFTLEDAQQLVDYVESNDDIAGISMWSLSRDNGDTEGYVSAVGSGLSQDDYDFSTIFNTVTTSDSSDDTAGDDTSDDSSDDTSDTDSGTDDTASGDTGDSSDNSDTTGDDTADDTDDSDTSGDSSDVADDSGSDDDSTGTTTSIVWNWGTDTVIDFDPSTDTLDFGWFSASNFDISEEDGNVVISIPSNDQTYILEDVSLADMSIDDIVANDASALAEWEDAIEEAQAEADALDTTDGLVA
ncbi:fibronectin type III domain-containing protein [Martelella sp. HB161492]|uniref:fibronectin type III domain-containing protein n=1 Tax=Martelella sp. HB161492 TaxID=2720726 RepID=UPI0015924707|nr:fibronectin type III domain-containing protein [Martelella sp. HB161492]